MCNAECCALKTALQIRIMKREIERKLRAELAKPIPKIIPSPQSLLYSYKYVKFVADLIISKTTIKPQFGLVCGTNFADLAELIDNPIIISYKDIPGFPQCTSPGHIGNLFIGTLNCATIMAMQGRVHSYEGNELASCGMPMRVMKLCGVETLFLTGVANSINVKYNVGDLMIIKDHINLMSWMGYSPLTGPHDKQFGSRYVDLKGAYDAQLREKAIHLAKDIGYNAHIHTGVYANVGGPTYETNAEQKIFRQLGIDVVGKSIIHEVTVARQCGMKVFACVFINLPAVERTVIDEANSAEGRRVCAELISRLIYTIKHNLLNDPAAPDDSNSSVEYVPVLELV